MDNNKTKVFIVMWNSLQYSKDMAEYLSDNGCEVILIDNASTYQPLLEWYKKCPYKIHYMDGKYKQNVFWDSGLIDNYSDKRYIVTDPDLGITHIPTDFLNKLHLGLDTNPDVAKCGFSLEVEDLPNNPFANHARQSDGVFWLTPQDINGFYKSAIDTTLAMYDKDRIVRPKKDINNIYFLSGVRTPRPYTAKHFFWYKTPQTLTQEDLYCLERKNTSYADDFKKLFAV